MKTQKTNAARLLDTMHIAYRTVRYEVDETDLGAAHLAMQLDEDPKRVFKTLVLHGDKSGHFVCVIPGDAELDLKKAAKASGNKSCSLIPVKELFSLTGYMRGGCSPIGMKKRFPTYVHHTAENFARIFVSAGQRGLQLELAPADLCAAIRGETRDLCPESADCRA